MTTHVGRHTFATFALANGVSIESVAKMLGHTNVQMTRHYARVLDRTVIREMSQIKMDLHFPCKERTFGMKIAGMRFKSLLFQKWPEIASGCFGNKFISCGAIRSIRKSNEST